MSVIAEPWMLMLLAGVAGAVGGAVAPILWRQVRRAPPAPAERRTPGVPRHGEVRQLTPAAPSMRGWRLPMAAPAPALAADLLLVDDSAVARAKLKRLFEPAGYRVQVASDGREALALLAQGRYAMMITDLEMPNMDGAALIRACRAQPVTAHLPILAITGHDHLGDKFNQCRDVSGVHRKPWVDDILLSHVAALVGTRQGRAVALAD